MSGVAGGACGSAIVGEGGAAIATGRAAAAEENGKQISTRSQ